MATVLTAARRSPPIAAAASSVAVALAAGALDHYGTNVNGAAWAIAVVLLIFVAWFDLLERRILNAVTLPAAVAVVTLRAIFVTHALVQSLIAGAAAFVVFLAFARLTSGGFGMGDVKLAGLIGLLLGYVAAHALLLGTVLGGIAALTLLATGSSRRSAYAYGPYLAAGAVIALLVEHPPPLT